MKTKFKIQWCKKCVLPNTRPNLIIHKSGLCSICSLKKKKDINWKARFKLLKNLVKEIKKKSKNNYDCIVPISGGKDSYWQILNAFKLGLKPLAVTWKPSGRNKLGDINLKNLINLGIDHIDYTINPKVESAMMLKALKEFGSIGVPMHLSIFNITYKLANLFNVHLVIWGENPSSEYGYKDISETNKNPDHNYFMNHNIVKNTKLNFWKSKNISDKDLNGYYFFPKKNKKIKSIFLGDYIKWDPKKVYKEAKLAGFKEGKKPKTGYYNFADLDDDFISIHHYLKWYKFGFTRLFDNLSIEIRNNRITRNEALRLILLNKATRPNEDIKKFCKFTKISVKKFNKEIEKFRNKKIWKKKRNKWLIENFILESYPW